MNPITAKSDHASRGTRILGVSVTVIASFFAVPEHAVTADCCRTSVEAIIGVDGIAIIALLALSWDCGSIDNTVAAFFDCAIGTAAITTYSVSVIAIFVAGIKDAITAAFK